MAKLTNGYDVAFSGRKREEAEGKCGGEKKYRGGAASKDAEGGRSSARKEVAAKVNPSKSKARQSDPVGAGTGDCLDLTACR